MDSPIHSYPSLSEVHQSVDTTSTRRPGWRKILSFFGPAYLVSVGYMDPGNWATDLAGGSQFGYKLIWVLLMSNLMALLLQSLSARLGIVRGKRPGTSQPRNISTLYQLCFVCFSRDRNCRMRSCRNTWYGNRITITHWLATYLGCINYCA
jgi:hypothetical protein